MSRTSKIVAFATVVVLTAAIPATLATARSSSVGVCERGQLGLRSNGSQGALGTIYGAWVVKNVSSTKCVLDGYPGIGLYGAKGRPISLTVQDSLKPGRSQVTLSPGGSATFRTSYSDVPPGPAGCPESLVIRVAAPGASASLFIPAELGPCRGILNVSAVESGVHPA
jgi:hypothetical protein